MKCCGEEQTVDARSLAPTAIALLEYLVRRQHPPKREEVVDVDAAVDEWLVEARAARTRFRRLVTPALRSIRQRAALARPDDGYRSMVKRYGGRKEIPLVELLHDAIKADEVSAILDRHNVPPNLVKAAL